MIKMRLHTRIVLSILVGIVALWLIAPTLIVIPVSFSPQDSFMLPKGELSLRWYENFFTNRSWTRALTNSAVVGLLVSVLATVLGTMTAIAVNNMKSKGAQVIRAMVLTPIIVPSIILAAGLYGFYLSAGLVGTLQGFVFAHTVLAIPMVFISVTASLSGFDKTLELASASLGANKFTTYRKVTIPLIAPGVIAGALLAFMTSFDEVIVATFIQSPALQTLPVKLFYSVTRDTDPTIAAVATLIFVVTTGAFVLFTFVIQPILNRRKLSVKE
ncbi:MAG: ABC transporter permease [Microbacteriaceae bacterium]